MKLRNLFLLAPVIILLADLARAADPRLDYIQPHGGQRGTEVEITLHGARVGQQPADILFYDPGIKLKQLEKVDDNQARATLSIAEDCRIGIHGLRVRTSTGVTPLTTFHVGALAERSEEEPNSDFAAPQAIPLDSTINGVVTSEDVDYFVVEAKKGQRLTAEIEGLRLGRTFFDPYVAILDQDRFELARCDDAPLLRQDATCSTVVPDDGKYIIEVRETAYGGNDASTYRLHAGRFPRPLGVFPPGGKPGEELEVRLLGDVLGETTARVKLPDEPQDDFEFVPADESGSPPSGLPMRVVDLDNVLEVEPNNKRDEATSATVPAALCGIIGEAEDEDYFRFAAKKDQVVHIRVFARQLRSPLDPVLVVRHADGRAIASNDDNAGQPDSYVRFQVPEDGEYFISMRDQLRAGGAHYTYRIEVTPPTPTVELQFQEWRRYFATTVAVPQGNRMAVMAQASRADVGGELDVEFAELPPGVRAETVTMPANRSLVPVVFHADAAAEPAGALAQVTARMTEENKSVTSRFSQRTWLVRGSNNREVWSHFADRAAVIVAEAAPYRVQIVAPQVPIVQRGSMQLKIVAERDEGFDRSILVRMLYNPPGVSSSRSISIAEGENEALIPLTANARAQVRDWEIVVLGHAGGMVVATPITMLRVAEPYLQFSMPKVAGEQGQTVELPIAVEQRQPFSGSAKVELVGLPPGASAEPMEITSETSQLVFHIQLAADARVGQHKGLFCRVVIEENGEPITHSVGSGELRVDEPLPATDGAPTASDTIAGKDKPT